MDGLIDGGGYRQIVRRIEERSHVEELLGDVGPAAFVVQDADGARGEGRELVSEQAVHRGHEDAHFALRREEGRDNAHRLAVRRFLFLEKHVEQDMVALCGFHGGGVEDAEMLLRRQVSVALASCSQPSRGASLLTVSSMTRSCPAVA